MTSVVSLRAFANLTKVPLVVLVDMQQEYLATPRLTAISEIDRALDNCCKVLDRSRRINLRMKLNRIGDCELKALCDEIAPGETGLECIGDPKSQAAPRGRPLLRVVK